jgi:hypothetical protein
MARDFVSVLPIIHHREANHADKRRLEDFSIKINHTMKMRTHEIPMKNLGDGVTKDHPPVSIKESFQSGFVLNDTW